MTDADRSDVTRRTLLGGAALSAALVAMPHPTFARAQDVQADPRTAFPLIRNGRPAAVFVDDEADSAVRRVAASFAGDLERVSGSPAKLIGGDADSLSGPAVLIGVAGRSPLLDRLVAEGRLDAADLRGEWEAFRQIVVDRPLPGVPRALVIIGSDRRGAVFGTCTPTRLSRSTSIEDLILRSSGDSVRHRRRQASEGVA